MQKQMGRSMVEMLGVLAIIGVLSIGGLLGYRRAVNNHQANVILDDVNRFAFVILERSGLALAENIDRGDFVESGTYKLTGFQGEDAGQFSITVKNVPEGVCEPLLAKAIVEYKVGIVAAGGSRDDEVLYDTLNTDLCQESNDISFYFGDTSGICNEPDGDGPCTQNSDCCGDYFCLLPGWPGDPPPNKKDPNGPGQCTELKGDYLPKTLVLSSGQVWTYSSGGLNWWSTQNWCETLGIKLAKRKDLGCEGVGAGNYCTSNGEAGIAIQGTVLRALEESGVIQSMIWLAEPYNEYSSYVAHASSNGSTMQSFISTGRWSYVRRALCH